MNGKDLKEWRKANSVTGTKAGLIFGRSRGTILRWERENKTLEHWVELLCEKHCGPSKSEHKRGRAVKVKRNHRTEYRWEKA